MVKIIDCGVDEFLRLIESQDLFLFGAGSRAELSYDNWNLKGKIKGIIDNNVALQNSAWKHDDDVFVYGLSDIAKDISIGKYKNISIMITSAYYPYQILEQLDNVPELNGVDCYIGNLVISHHVPQEFEFSKGEQKIPKIIHYFWFGGEMPDHLKKCVDSWYKFCPDYEIKKWNETNYDVAQNSYMYETYQKRKWGFVPDYARIDVVHKYGGIYLDTDVELLKSPDVLLNDEFFCCAPYNLCFNFGCGFGAVKGNEILKRILESYSGKHFIKSDGSLDLRPCQFFHDPILKEYGFTPKSLYQKINNAVVYPAEVMNPYNAFSLDLVENFTPMTIGIHHGERSWTSDDEKSNFELYRKNMKKRMTGGGYTKYIIQLPAKKPAAVWRGRWAYAA